jgi:glucokinase
MGIDHVDLPDRRLGIDVGGTKCLAILLDAEGDVIASERRPTPKEPEELIDRLCDLYDTVGPSDTIGVGVPGLVTRDGLFRASPHIGKVADFPVRARLAERLGHDVVVDNDATCALVAEAALGVARDVRDAVLVTLGTGIGGGVLAGGVVQRGANGFVGEIGHMVVDPDGPDCPCGRRGCWERFASGSALALFGREAAKEGRLPAVLELAGGDADAIRGEDVTTAARAGDPGGLAILDRFGRWVAIGLVNLTNLLDPEMFILGGGLVGLHDLVVDPIRHWFGELLYAPSYRPHPRLEVARLEERSGAIGAALLPESTRS